MIQPVESLEITILVDNGTDSLSTNPGFVEAEMAGAWRRGMKWLSGRCLCCAAHGLSCLITTRTPSLQHTLLFDTGPDETIFERNVIRLGVDMGGVDAMMLSHGHWDHAGTMVRAEDDDPGEQGPARADLHAPRHVRLACSEGPGWPSDAHGGHSQPACPVGEWG
jgi:metal-dependent hydrolase (beta-lactamase superfamily II)